MFFSSCTAEHPAVQLLANFEIGKLFLYGYQVEQIADFALFLLVKHKATPPYENWNEQEWQNFSLEQFFREDDDVT